MEKNKDLIKETEEYKEKICDVIMNINDVNVLMLIYNLINSMKKKWGV